MQARFCQGCGATIQIDWPVVAASASASETPQTSSPHIAPIKSAPTANLSSIASPTPQRSTALQTAPAPPEDERWERLQRLMPEEYAQKLQLEVHFTRKLTKEEWISQSLHYNIFINTTNYDNTPVSVIEAMALGLPVVSTNVGGMPYLIVSGVDGLLVPPNDAEMMAKAILEINSNKELAQKIALNAREKVELFDWSVVKERWKTILE